MPSRILQYVCVGADIRARGQSGRGTPDGGNRDAKPPGSVLPKALYTPAAHIQSSIHLPSMSPRLHDCSPSPYVHISSTLHLQRTSRAPGLLTQTPPRRHACSRPLAIPLRGNMPAAHLYTSIPPHYDTYSLPPELLRQIEATPTARRQNSIPPCRPRLHACSPSPYLLISTPTAFLRSSRAPFLRTSSSLHLQRASRPPDLLRQIEATRLQRASGAPGLLRQIEATRLQRTSIRLHLHVYTPAARPLELRGS